MKTFYASLVGFTSIQFATLNLFVKTFEGSFNESGLINKRTNCFLSVIHPPSLLLNLPSAATRNKMVNCSLKNMFPCLVPFRRTFQGFERKRFTSNHG